MIKVIYILFVSVLISCTPKMSPDKNASQAEGEVADYTLKAYEVLNVTPISFEKNSTGQYVLATYIDDSGVPGAAPVRIAVINTGTNEVVLKQVTNNGSAQWKSAFILEIVAPPGMPKGDQERLKDYTFLYDVRSGEKVRSLDVKITD